MALSHRGAVARRRSLYYPYWLDRLDLRLPGRPNPQCHGVSCPWAVEWQPDAKGHETIVVSGDRFHDERGARRVTPLQEHGNFEVCSSKISGVSRDGGGHGQDSDEQSRSAPFSSPHHHCSSGGKAVFHAWAAHWQIRFILATVPKVP